MDGRKLIAIIVELMGVEIQNFRRAPASLFPDFKLEVVLQLEMEFINFFSAKIDSSFVFQLYNKGGCTRFY